MMSGKLLSKQAADKKQDNLKDRDSGYKKSEPVDKEDSIIPSDVRKEKPILPARANTARKRYLVKSRHNGDDFHDTYSSCDATVNENRIQPKIVDALIIKEIKVERRRKDALLLVPTNNKTKTRGIKVCGGNDSKRTEKTNTRVDRNSLCCPAIKNKASSENKTSSKALNTNSKTINPTGNTGQQKRFCEVNSKLGLCAKQEGCNLKTGSDYTKSKKVNPTVSERVQQSELCSDIAQADDSKVFGLKEEKVKQLNNDLQFVSATTQMEGKRTYDAHNNGLATENNASRPNSEDNARGEQQNEELNKNVKADEKVKRDDLYENEILNINNNNNQKKHSDVSSDNIREKIFASQTLAEKIKEHFDDDGRGFSKENSPRENSMLFEGKLNSSKPEDESNKDIDKSNFTDEQEKKSQNTVCDFNKNKHSHKTVDANLLHLSLNSNDEVLTKDKINYTDYDAQQGCSMKLKENDELELKNQSNTVKHRNDVKEKQTDQISEIDSKIIQENFKVRTNEKRKEDTGVNNDSKCLSNSKKIEQFNDISTISSRSESNRTKLGLNHEAVDKKTKKSGIKEYKGFNERKIPFTRGLPKKSHELNKERSNKRITQTKTRCTKAADHDSNSSNNISKIKHASNSKVGNRPSHSSDNSKEKPHFDSQKLMARSRITAKQAIKNKIVIPGNQTPFPNHQPVDKIHNLVSELRTLKNVARRNAIEANNSVKKEEKYKIGIKMVETSSRFQEVKSSNGKPTTTHATVKGSIHNSKNTIAIDDKKNVPRD